MTSDNYYDKYIKYKNKYKNKFMTNLYGGNNTRCKACAQYYNEMTLDRSDTSNDSAKLSNIIMELSNRIDNNTYDPVDTETLQSLHILVNKLENINNASDNIPRLPPDLLTRTLGIINK